LELSNLNAKTLLNQRFGTHFQTLLLFLAMSVRGSVGFFLNFF